MKFVFLAGGFAGFALTAGAGYLAERNATNIILDASIGCLVGAVLFRWFWSVALSTMQETVELKAREEAATAAAAPTQPVHHR